jgi:hypothetical protein
MSSIACSRVLSNSRAEHVFGARKTASDVNPTKAPLVGATNGLSEKKLLPLLKALLRKT